MNDGQHIGGRYGIWGINPYGPTIKRTPLLQGMFNAAEKTGDVLKRGYENQQEAAKAQLMQGTLGSEIDAKNIKNQADAKYYPLQQMFKTQQEQATVKEIMARTGASYAQAQHMLAAAGAEGARGNLYNTQSRAMTDPTMMFDTLYSKLKAAPPNSPQRAMLSSMLSSMLNAGGMASTGKNSKASPLNSMFNQRGGAPGAPGMQINPLQGSTRSGFHQAATTDANGNPVTIESPTMASATRNQMRKEAEAEAGYIVPTVLSGINNYQGNFPTLSLLQDSLTARGKGKAAEAAKQRLQQYALARRFVPELTAINARQATGQAPGIEVMREFQGSMFPHLPKDFASGFIPSDIKINAANAYPGLQQGLAGQAINQERTGFEQEGAPAWATNETYPNGRIDEQGNYIPPEQAAPQQQSQQPKFEAAQLNSWAEEAIAKGADPAAVRARLQQMQRGG